MSVPSGGRMTVQLYERESIEGGLGMSVQRGEDETNVLAVVISYGDHMIQVGLDEERDTWEIEVVGQSTIYHQ